MAGLRLALAVVAAAAAAACAGAPEASPTSAKWYGIFLDGGMRIGASSYVVTPWQAGERTVETLEMLFSEADRHVVRVVDRTTRYTDAEGRTTRIERTSGSGSETVQLVVDILDGTAIAVRKTPYDQNTLRIELPSDVRFDDGAGLLPGWDFEASNEIGFENFNAVGMVVEKVVLRSLSRDAVTGARRMERAAYRNGALSSASGFIIDAGGEIVETSLDVLGAHLAVRPISQAEAATPGSPASLVSSAMVKSPNRISARAVRGHIRYVFGFGGAPAFDFPQTSEQKATRRGEEVIVDICADCGPGLTTDPEFLAAGLRPTMWLQSGSDKLREMAAFPAGEVLSDRSKMQSLGLRARRTLRALDFTGHYSALEAAERRAGDCTEDAVLLTALARAAGIPAYVATGLVYSRERYHGVSNAFMPHNWTVAYVDGEWASFDISLGDFDATHIALSINEGEATALGSAQQLASHLEWKSMTEVRTAAPVP